MVSDNFSGYHDRTMPSMYVLLDALSALTALSELDPKTTSEQDVLDRAAGILLKYYDIYSCSVFLSFDHELHCAVGASRDDVSIGAGKHGCNRFRETEGVMGNVFQSGETYYCENIGLDQNFVNKDSMSVSVNSLLSVPLIVDKQKLGVMNVSHPLPSFFDHVARRAFELFAAWLSRQIMAVRQYRQLTDEVDKRTEELNTALLTSEQLQRQFQELSLTDDLTKLRNRRYFFSEGEGWLRKALLAKGFVSLILLDLDNFKRVNDCWGHVAGDTVLQSIGAVLANIIREEDLLARLGGEEFVIAVEAPLEKAQCFAERIQRELGQLYIPDIEGQKVTASMGITTHNLADENNVSLDALYQEADEAMYESKRHGRDCVSVYGE